MTYTHRITDAAGELVCRVSNPRVLNHPRDGRQSIVVDGYEVEQDTRRDPAVFEVGFTRRGVAYFNTRCTVERLPELELSLTRALLRDAQAALVAGGPSTLALRQQIKRALSAGDQDRVIDITQLPVESM